MTLAKSPSWGESIGIRDSHVMHPLARCLKSKLVKNLIQWVSEDVVDEPPKTNP